jgi:hypothetical protein
MALIKCGCTYSNPLLNKYSPNYLVGRKVKVLIFLNNFPDFLCTERET